MSFHLADATNELKNITRTQSPPLPAVTPNYDLRDIRDLRDVRPHSTPLPYDYFMRTHSPYYDHHQPHHTTYFDFPAPAPPHFSAAHDHDQLLRTKSSYDPPQQLQHQQPPRAPQQAQQQQKPPKIKKPRGRRVATTDTIDLSQLKDGKKLFICTEPSCSKVFKRAEHLNRHYRMHSGERPYPCMECDRAFSRSDNLSAHIARTHKNSNKKFTPSPALTPSPSPRPASAMSTMSSMSTATTTSSMSTTGYPELSYSPSIPDFAQHSQAPPTQSFQSRFANSFDPYPMLYAPAPRPALTSPPQEFGYFQPPVTSDNALDNMDNRWSSPVPYY